MRKLETCSMVILQRNRIRIVGLPFMCIYIQRNKRSQVANWLCTCIMQIAGDGRVLVWMTASRGGAGIWGEGVGGGELD